MEGRAAPCPAGEGVVRAWLSNRLFVVGLCAWRGGEAGVVLDMLFVLWGGLRGCAAQPTVQTSPAWTATPGLACLGVSQQGAVIVRVLLHPPLVDKRVLPTYQPGLANLVRCGRLVPVCPCLRDKTYSQRMCAMRMLCLL
jgi:hypothetical protein